MKYSIKTTLAVAAVLLVFAGCRNTNAPKETEIARTGVQAKAWPGFEHGMGIGGWLTNYKRFNVLPQDRRLVLSPGDFEHFDTYITEEDVKNIASMGMDHIRLGFDQIVIEESPGVYRDRIFKLIDNFVGWCEKYKLNVVLNLHKAVGNYADIKETTTLLEDKGLQDRFVDLWLAFEKHYADKPDIVFELMNEVRDVPSGPWIDLYERTVNEIHKINPKRMLVVGGTYWNSPAKLSELKVLDDPYVAYTFHNYEPFAFTHQRGVLQAAPLYYNRAMKWPSDIEPFRDYDRFVYGNDNAYPDREVMDKDYLRKVLQPAIDFIQAHPDKILWCGEFGTIRHADITSRENYMGDLISILKEHSIPYCVWNYLSTPNDGNRFSLVDDDTRKILSPRMLRAIQGKPLD